MIGTAAGGGFPQWNCACPNCQSVRNGEDGLKPLMQSSLAISVNGEDWYLINAGPDVNRQILSFSELHAGPGIREIPLAGVILTDAELDHTIGLLCLREGSSLTIYGTDTVYRNLNRAFPVFPMLENYCSWEWQTLAPNAPLQIGNQADGLVTIETIPVSSKPPLYASSQSEIGDVWEVGLLLHNEQTGKCLAYFPTIESFTPEIEASLQKADVVMVDGTFWSAGELVQLGATSRNAHDMGHLPVGGASGIAEKLRSLPAERKILIHINNSNPILRKGSMERKTLDKLGIEVAYDGLELEV
ncbi:pyrroloquinoline quinone biosynthesis protein PqqB [Salirhabdus sp. Marseille-P4669]|uniref:pyrroloquinoline quinone biosynthesis protein PqqB n=1 Tax=Salirhabdus sp. Marseille-P4669 TaxID=2042310 RepID=UPI00135A3C50|nr:pyrroloquinoline quinone biosynthesis protein PqqB [Salirhabdus sp. Marseille-P4669]